MSVFNTFLILKIGFQTLITLQNLMFIYLVPMVASGLFFYFYKKDTLKKVYRLALCWTPLLINIFFVINFMFSHSPVKEYYEYDREKNIQLSDGELGGTTTIILEGNAYEKYKGIRMFLAFDHVKFNYHIWYTFEDGLLGIKVLKNYQFEY